MKNRLIYGLIGLMLVSLIGIISIQNNWITDAIAERERDFRVHVNDALNAFNDAIEDEETEIFIERRFGGVDSILGDVIFEPEQGVSKVEVQIKESNDGVKDTRELVILSESNQKNTRRHQIDIHSFDTVRRSESMREGNLQWRETLNEHLKDLDSTLKEEEVMLHRIHNVESMVEHYTFEMMLTGDLEDRIQPDELEKKLKKSLHKEGIYTPFEFAVKNTESGNIEEEFTSKGFSSSETEGQFVKKMFPHDRQNRMSYELIVQPGDNGNYVWARVWKMTMLSIVFTVLILITFGYALYFIFKQKRLSQIKNDFINNMTHELKTPLASISLATSSIKHPEIINNPDEIRRLSQIIETEKERINHHIERVLDTAALDAGELRLQFEPVSVTGILQRAQKNVELALLNSGGTFEVTGGDVLVTADPFHLTNALTNIFDNSIKYRSERPVKISVKISSEGSNCKLSISDNGIGMTAREQKLAFDTFYRAESGDIHNRKGFGLGLSYVKSVIEKHRGSVSLISKRNEGTTVEILLPKAENE